MTPFAEALGLAEPEGIPTTFQPIAGFFDAMDCLVYLKEDVSYRAVRLSPYVTVLIDPIEDLKAVGIKIKGVRVIIKRALAILHAAGREDISELQVIAILETAFTASLGDEMMQEAEAERRKKYEAQARALAEEAGSVSLIGLQALAA